MTQQQPQRRRSSSGGPARSEGVHWEVRRTRKPWQRFLEKFGFTLIALGIAMMVGVLIARMG